MVRLPESDAGAAAGDGAQVDGLEAGEEARGPFCGAGRVRDPRGVLHGVLCFDDPVVDVVLHGGFLGWGGHDWGGCISGWVGLFLRKGGMEVKEVAVGDVKG